MLGILNIRRQQSRSMFEQVVLIKLCGMHIGRAHESRRKTTFRRRMQVGMGAGPKRRDRAEMTKFIIETCEVVKSLSGKNNISHVTVKM